MVLKTSFVADAARSLGCLEKLAFKVFPGSAVTWIFPSETCALKECKADGAGASSVHDDRSQFLPIAPVSAVDPPISPVQTLKQASKDHYDDKHRHNYLRTDLRATDFSDISNGQHWHWSEMHTIRLCRLR